MPSELHIISGNHLEMLVRGLAEVLATPVEASPRAVLQPDVVLVQSRGMQRWISLQVASINGVCANIEFPFPNAFIDRLCGLVDASFGMTGAYDKQTLAFRIYHLLPGLLAHSVFEPLQHYLVHDANPLKRFLLSRKIADTFDQYAVFRPDWLVGWETGRAGAERLPPSHQWQAYLWRALEAQQTGSHRSALQKDLVERLLQNDRAWHGLPSRIAVFGVSHLPPFHLEVLEALAQRIPVFLFLLNPCRHYWADILSDQQMVRLRSRIPGAPDNGALYFQSGNRLLASLGLQGKQFFDLIHQCEAHHHELFQDNRNDLLLGRIQQDILDLVDRRRPNEEPPDGGVHADGSLRVHSCHSPMREVEVLYDQLLDMLDHTPDLEPRDILVMAPDIAVYAPFIHAVFGNPAEAAPNIPYSVADQNLLASNSTINAFIQLLDLVDSRMEASRVSSLLSCPSIQSRFGLFESDLQLIHRLVKEAGIRWGWDRADRSRHGLPGFRENTWQEGLDRLILGWSMDSRESRLFSEILPFQSIAAGDGEILGRVIAYADAIHESVTQLDACVDSLEGWQVRLNALFERFFQLGPSEISHSQPLKSTINRLKEIGLQLDEKATFSFDIIRQYLKDTLKQTSREAGFMTGGITFCAMLPMRSIPSRIICLLGMNHETFPRENHEPGFNLIAAEPRAGDRSRRNDDRYLFLEALISARDIFYLSCIGQNIQDNSTMAPSVVVDELLEYVAEGLGVPAEKLVVRHPLHAFSTLYFSGLDKQLFTYSAENRKAAEALISPSETEPFFTESLQSPDDHWRQCDWRDLGVFWMHPIRFLIENRLGVYLKPAADVVEDREIFKLDALSRYMVNQDLLKALAGGTSKQEAYRIVRAANMLPHGTVGRVECEQLEDHVEKFLNTLKAIVPNEKPRSVQVDKALSPFAVNGEIDRVYPQGRIVYRMGKVRPKDLLGAFIHHLALQFCPDTHVIPMSMLICTDQIWHFSPIEAPENILAQYLCYYWEGLRAPLPFYCRSSHAYAHQLIVNGRTKKEALAFAQRTWLGNEFSPGEASDPYHQLCFRKSAPFSEAFEKIALDLFGPLLSVSHSTTPENLQDASFLE